MTKSSSATIAAEVREPSTQTPIGMGFNPSAPVDADVTSPQGSSAEILVIARVSLAALGRPHHSEEGRKQSSRPRQCRRRGQSLVASRTQGSVAPDPDAL